MVKQVRENCMNRKKCQKKKRSWDKYLVISGNDFAAIRLVRLPNRRIDYGKKERESMDDNVEEGIPILRRDNHMVQINHSNYDSKDCFFLV